MKKLFSLGWGVVVLAAWVLALPVAGVGTKVSGSSADVEFWLAGTGGEAGPLPFVLAPGSMEPSALAGPAGLGLVEDPGSPFRTGIGFEALAGNTAGEGNTAVGFWALRYNSEGNDNTAVGYLALQHGLGHDNTAVGAHSKYGSGNFNTSLGSRTLGNNMLSGGDYNTALGYGTMLANRGSDSNTAVGALALNGNVNGSYNTAVGHGALEISGSGFEGGQSYNTALGYRAGAATLGGSGHTGFYNIFIGANQLGEAHDDNTIRIGLPYAAADDAGQNRTFIAGIVETPFAPSDEPAVVGITTEGRLGTFPSELLPKGDTGDQGIQGPPGPPGEGLVPGSLLFLPASVAPPAGYSLLGSTQFLMIRRTGRPTLFTVNIYQKL